jgi:hypothetical protein
MAYKNRYFASVPATSSRETPIDIPIPIPDEEWFKHGEYYRLYGKLYTWDDLNSSSILYEESIPDLLGDWIASGMTKTLGEFARGEPQPENRDYPMTFYKKDLREFVEGGDAWVAINAGYEVTIDRTGLIIDVWDPVTKATYDQLGGKITDRETAYSRTPITPKVEPYQKPPTIEYPKAIPIPKEPKIPISPYEKDLPAAWLQLEAIQKYLKDLEVFNGTVASYFFAGFVVTQRYLEELSAARVLGTQTENAKIQLEELDKITTELERALS